MNKQEGIRWPERYKPGNAPVHVKNDLEIQASSQSIWAWLIRAELWPTWYINSAHVQFLDGTPPDLALGTRFKWKTFGLKLDSQVVEFIPNERIAWNAHGFGVDAYHAWLITPTPQGCHVLTEETQYGWIARLAHFFTPNLMYRGHHIWLKSLRDKASKGLPPAA